MVRKLIWVVLIVLGLKIESQRYFVAIDIPSDVEPVVSSVSKMLQNKFMGKFEPPEKYHITLNFLGDMTPKELVLLQTRFSECLHAQSCFEIELANLGFFSNISNARVAWVGVQSPELYIVQKKLADVFLLKEQREFHPHVTLVRLDPIPPSKILEPSQKKIENRGVLARFTVQEIVLMESQDGVYLPVFTVRLQPKK